MPWKKLLSSSCPTWLPSRGTGAQGAPEVSGLMSELEIPNRGMCPLLEKNSLKLSQPHPGHGAQLFTPLIPPGAVNSPPHVTCFMLRLS